MKKIYHSLETKLITSFVLLILIVAGGTFFITFGETKKALLQSTRDDLQQIIGIASNQLGPREVSIISAFQPGDEATSAYQALTEKFRAMRADSPNIVNFYVMRIQGDQVTFLLDDATEDPAGIGQVYAQPEPGVFQAARAIQVSDQVYTDEWGSFLSAYAPIGAADGRTVFVLGADMLATTVIARQNFIGDTIYLIMGIAILVAAFLIGLFSVTIIRDIKKLNLAAQRISTGDTNVHIDVHRNDEIGELSDSFERMVTSLKILMDVEES